MRGVFAKGLLALAAAAGIFAAAPAHAAADKNACDRVCLEGLIDKYLTGLATKDFSKVPFGRTLRFVENLQPLRVGQGTWASVDGLGQYRHLFADPEAGRAAVITTVREHGRGAILDLVIKVENRRITEVESQIIRDAAGAERYEKLAAPEPLWLQPVAPAERIGRQALMDTANKYFTGMQRNHPKGDYSFFDPECERLEHASKTTNLKTPEAYGHSTDTDFSSMGCQAQFQTGFLGFVTELRDRRFMVVDEERQAVFAWVSLDHNGTVRLLHLSTGKDFKLPAYFDVPRGLQVGEAFRMRRDRIHRIEMTLVEVPYGMRPDGAAPPASGTAPAPAKGKEPPPCARACLNDLLVTVLQAIADHRPADAKLAPDIRYTENGQPLKPGDGIWQTATAVAMPGDGLSSLGPSMRAYKLALADPATGQAACLCAVNENGTPGMMALRIRAAAGKVTEIEAIIVREEGAGPRGGTLALFRTQPIAEFTAKAFTEPAPQLTARPSQRTVKAVMAVDVGRWLDTVAYNHRAQPPMALEGANRLNGRDLDAPPTADVRARRTLLLDEETGLALFAAVLDHDGKAAPEVPRSNLLAGVMKIDAGKIQRVEALERWVPYGMTTGWPE
jgi:hypothetical protein